MQVRPAPVRAAPGPSPLALAGPAVLLAGLACLALVVPWPAGTDLAASTSHALFAAQHGLTPVDLSWYGGTSQPGYSLWAQLAMAALGTRVVGVLSGLVAAGAFGLLLHRGAAAGHVRRPMLGALTGAVCVVLNLVSGRMTYGLGLAVGLLALLALPRRLPAAGLAALATAASPVAGLFVGLAGAALLLDGRRRDGLALAVPAALLLVVVGIVLGQGGVNGMPVEDMLAAVLLTGVAAAAVRVRVVRVGAALLAVGLVVAYLVPTPVGLNAARLPVMFAVPLLLACAPWRPRVVTAVALAVTVVRPPVQLSDLLHAASPVNRPGYFAPVAAELARRAPTGRVEAVPTVDYWEAVHLADVAPLARGWLRQQDTRRNPLFFDGTLSAATYGAWLRDTGVQYVALPPGPLAGPGREEAALVRAGLPYLSPVWSGAGWTLYAVAGSPAIADGARVLGSTRAELALQVDRPGDVLVRLQPSRWLTLDGPAGACLAPEGRWVRLHADRPGTYLVGSSLLPRSARC